MKILGWVVVLLVVAGGGLYGYWYFTVYQPEQQAYADLHQAAENASSQTQQALNEAQNYGGLTNNPTSPTPTPTAPAPSPTPKGTSSVVAQTVSDSKNLSQMRIPASWVSQISGDSSTSEWSQSALVYGKPPPPTIAVTVTQNLSSGPSCDTIVMNTVAHDSNQYQNFQQKPIIITGSDKAILESGTDPSSSNSGNIIRLYICTANNMFTVQGMFLGTAQSPNTSVIDIVNNALTSFRLTAQ